MRFLKVIKKPSTSYLTEGEEYEIESLNCPDVRFQRKGGPYPCATYLPLWQVKEYLQNGGFIFTDTAPSVDTSAGNNSVAPAKKEEGSVGKFMPLQVTWKLLRERAQEVTCDGRTLEQRLNEIESYKEDGDNTARCGLNMGLVGYEELNDEEAYEKAHNS